MVFRLLPSLSDKILVTDQRGDEDRRLRFATLLFSILHPRSFGNRSRPESRHGPERVPSRLSERWGHLKFYRVRSSVWTRGGLVSLALLEVGCRGRIQRT